MSLKSSLKYGFGYIRCKLKKVSFKKGDKIYIGKNVKIIGGKKILLSDKVCIRPDVDLWCSGRGIKIGKGTEIGERVRISIANSLEIGEDVLISPNVYITDCDHAYENVGVPIISQDIVKNDNEVVIKQHSYIGINSVIAGDVTIGKGSVVGANSVVTKNVPDYCVVAGAPAKIIKQYNLTTKLWERV